MTVWQTDTSVSNKSWGYIEHDTFKTPAFIVHQLADVVSKNGNLLLNIGPRADGTIPDEVQQVLRAVGGWLKVNGDAIYGTRPWKIYGEGPTKVAAGSFHDTKTQEYTAEDFRFTTKGNDLYAIEMGWPSEKRDCDSFRDWGGAQGQTDQERCFAGVGGWSHLSFATRWVAYRGSRETSGRLRIFVPDRAGWGGAGVNVHVQCPSSTRFVSGHDPGLALPRVQSRRDG